MSGAAKALSSHADMVATRKPLHRMLIALFLLSVISFMLSGCSEAGKFAPPKDLDIPRTSTTAKLSLYASESFSTSTTTSMDGSSSGVQVATAGTTTTSTPTLVSTAFDAQALVGGSISMSLPGSDSPLSDMVVRDAIIEGIANAHNVASKYVSINITQMPGRLLAETSLRKSVSAFRVDYIISVLTDMVAVDRTKLAKTASDMTLATISDAVKATMQARKGANFAASVEVRTMAVPEMIASTATATTAPTTSTATTTTTTTSTSTTTSTTRSPEADAQFLMQATFGPTRASLASLQSGSLTEWIRNQMELPVGSHRAYYRARSNPRVNVEVPAGAPRGLCTKGSRWLRFAFSRADLKKEVSVQNNKIYVGGVLRSEIAPSYAANGLHAPNTTCTDLPHPHWSASRTCLKEKQPSCRMNPWWETEGFCKQSCYNKGRGYVGLDCSVGWPSFNFSGFICGVDDHVAGWVGLSTDSNCGHKSLQGMQNPGIWFADSSHIVTSSLSFNDATPGVKLLEEGSSSCNLGTFINLEGKVYMHESRLELLQNELGKPATVAPAASCPTVAKTFLNEKSCKLQSACTPLHLGAAPFPLNRTNLEKFYTIEQKYLFEIVGLDTTASPCGTTSRWARLDCSSEACMTSSMSGSDTSAITSALQLQGGWLRDISVNCDSVPAKATVQVGSEFFKNVHISEHNVYDFSTWVDAHPGGSSFIKMWVDHNFQLTFPSNHPMTRWLAGTTQNKIFLIGRMDDMVEFAELPTDLQTPALAAAFNSAKESSYFQACGSPNEVANDPSLGNEAPFWYVFASSSDKQIDKNLEKPHWQNVPEQRTKTQVWTMHALTADDQLRQRMAWALSQIFVTGVPGYGMDPFAEMWVNYYDIFTRNAFGNYRDVLREVTYSPLMGEYLTFKQNSAYDYNSNYPDENYAREIMQLFTIGLYKLHGNGSKVLDAQGKAVQTYGNEDITNFARVFTGFDEQLPRGNIEILKGQRNKIDPMRMRKTWHDVYPKPDLDGNYIGDGYPLCSDIPPRAFLAKGANYTFLGYMHSGSYVKELSQGSALYLELCSASSGSCNFALNVQLGSHLACYNEECNMDMVEVVKVGNGYYEYTPPRCVHLYFHNGQIAVRGDKNTNHADKKCENPDAQAAGTSCCGTVDGMEKEARVCGQPAERVRFSVAEDTCRGLGLTVCPSKTSASSCGFDSKSKLVWTPFTCTLEIEIDSEGKVSAQTDLKTRQNKFAVQWLDGFPTAAACPSGCVSAAGTCTCSVNVTTEKVFDHVPSQQELKAHLTIGAFAPDVACTVCSGDVQSYLTSSVIDENTVFESQGRYYKNVRSIGAAGGHHFRNPPAFMRARLPSETAALSEVEALLGHLFHHSNTPVFVSYRLIQRFGNSNPSPSYIADVSAAFRTGAYDGTVYSGQYGDLAATVAAILLHSEARDPQSATQGSLREPIVKVMHFLRSMEYVDTNHDSTVLNKLDDLIGQEPFQSPSVFNFYQPDYQPPAFSGDAVAPEFQVFTAPWAVGLINGLFSMIDYGVSSCGKGLGFSNPWSCNVGEFELQEKSTIGDTIAELNLLLTGGRLTSTDIATSAYETAEVGDKFKAAQRAIVLSPEFHTIGNPLPSGTRSEAHVPAVGPASSYKATVMLFMGGGADTFNMLIPNEGRLLTEYQAVRKDIALASHELLNITTAGQSISKFALHHKLPFLRELYNDGHAALISNVGALVEPTTKEQYKSDSAEKCVGLFSHSDQQAAAATLKCQVAGTSPKGAGGRIGDALKDKSYRTNSFSLAGTSTWSQGVHTTQEIVSPSQGAVRLASYSSVNPLLKSITNRTHQNVYCEEYARSISNFVEASESLGNTLDAVTLNTSFTASSGLGKQLKQVSRLIAARETRQVERDLFYVNIGGFDAHSLAAEVLAEKFTIIDDALKEFVTELKAQNIFQSVVIASESDFGRTLSTNGAGTDHAWAGNHFVIGGSINGGRVYNDFPDSLLLGSEQDLGRGRLIPKYPWESMIVPIAEWMGVEESQHPTVFPNLAKFDKAKHILAKDTLFNQ